MRRALTRLILLGVLSVAGDASAFGETAPGSLPRLFTNEAEIEDARRSSALAIDDPAAVFAFVLGQLPDRVRVYPTENY